MPDLDSDSPYEPLDHHSVNLYRWTNEGLCVDERISAIKHDSLVGLTIEDLMRLDRNIFPSFVRALQGEGSSWTQTTNGVPSLNGFFAINPDQTVIGFSMLLDEDALLFLS